MSRRSFFYFEPVELDVVLSAPSSANRSFRVPDCIDPGYGAFRIWIEEPSGERRIYRSPRIYCAHDELIFVGPKKPFRRDISIFGESGGFTFRRAGVHKVWAEFALSREPCCDRKAWKSKFARSENQARSSSARMNYSNPSPGEPCAITGSIDSAAEPFESLKNI